MYLYNCTQERYKLKVNNLGEIHSLLFRRHAHNGVVLGSSPSGPTKSYLKYFFNTKI